MASEPLHSDIGSDSWEEKDWKALLLSIRHKQCTPFLGAGACAGVLPLGRDIARELADEYDFPFPNLDDLVRVAQFVAVEGGPMTPKYRIIEKLFGKGPPDFSNPSEPHRVVADLDLPVYITTNYDDFMMKALERSLPKKRPRREICKWHLARKRQLTLLSPDLNPTPTEPVVFYLHGYLEDAHSIVLTEDDYLDFLMCISEDQRLIPPRIEQAFSDSSLLFMGYSLEDMNFKVLFRKLASYMQRNEGARHVSVQLAPGREGTTEDQLLQARKQRTYLEHHFDLRKVKVYWGTCEEFAADLRAHWEAFQTS
jgi:SIR2-like domain